MLRRALFFSAAALALGCGGAPNAQPVSASTAPTSGGPSASAPTAARGPLREVAALWPFAHAESFVYVDAEGFLKSKVAVGLPAKIVALGQGSMKPEEKTCLEAILRSVKTFAMGEEGGEMLVLVGFEPGSQKEMTGCFANEKGATPVQVAGATDAWASKDGSITAFASGWMVEGAKETVEKALAKRGTGAGLPSLGPDEYARFSLHVQGVPVKGSLVASAERFHVAVTGDLPDERPAREIEKEWNGGGLASVLGQGPNAERLAKAITLRRTGKTLDVALELLESPEEQAKDLDTLTTLAMKGVRTYISSAKKAEAHAVVKEIGRSVAMAWEREDGKPKAKKKLVSFGPVPKSVPRGAKVQTSEADWKAWAPLHFSMTEPQYYQYEVVAAKNGESAEVLARGDLNGDGKTSLFRMVVKVDRSSNLVNLSPIEEKDPDE